MLFSLILSGWLLRPSLAQTKIFQTEAVTSPHTFTRGIEGPAVDTNGNLYALDFAKEGTIGIISPGKKAALWLTLPEPTRSSSIRFDSDGKMYVADYKGHRLLQIDRATKIIQEVFHEPKMNQPNDFAISAQGEMYFSDPSWKKKISGKIWRFSRDHHLEVAARDLRAVNGIDLSPDGKKLYFSESIGGGVWSFNIEGSKLVGKKLIHSFAKDTVDGLRVDGEGNIYVARITRGQIDRLSPDGEVLNEIKLLGKDPTNMAFGGPDGRRMYVTVRDTGQVESFLVPLPGREWLLQKKKRP